jgi:hypothetical protein
MRELRRAAPPGRWPRRESRGTVRDGGVGLARPLSRGSAAEAAPPTPGGRPRYHSAGGDPPLRDTRHRTMRNRPRPSLRTQPVVSRERVSMWWASPLTPAQRLSGGRLRSRQGRAFGSSLRDGASATLDRTWPRVPGPHGACRVEGRSGRSPSHPWKDDYSEHRWPILSAKIYYCP